MAEYLFRCASEKLEREKEKLPAKCHEAITWLESKFSWLGNRSDKQDLEMKQRLIRNRLSDLTSIAQETENVVDSFVRYVPQRPPLRLKDRLLARLEMPCMKEKFSQRVLRREEVSVVMTIGLIREKMKVILTSTPSDEEIVAGTDSPTELASIYNALEDDETKLCFLFRGLFPEGCKISKRRLVNLWIAEGWVEEGEKDTETIYQEKMATFTTTSLCAGVQEFCIMRAKELNLYTIDQGKNQDSSSSSSSRGEIISRLALHSVGIDMFFPEATLPSDLRSLFCFPHPTPSKGKASFFQELGRFNLLKVLDLEDMYFITGLPEDMGQNLTRLRYLGLRRTGLERLPDSLGSLTNLQTLDIKHTRVRSIPNSIEKLKRLRHLYMDMNHSSADDDDDDHVFSPDVSGSEELRVLSMVRADRWMEDGIKKLSNLRKLGIYGELDLCNNALHNCIPRMKRLKWLRLGFGLEDVDFESILTSLKKSDSGIRHLYLERSLSGLPGEDKFHNNLEYLCLKWSQLEQDPMPTLGKLPHLKVLKLCCASFLGKKMVCSADGFPVLNALELSQLEGLEEWTVQERAMPKLNRLVVHLCKRLKMLPPLQYLKNLEELDVAGMPLHFRARLQESTEDEWCQIIAHNTGLELELIGSILLLSMFHVEEEDLSLPVQTTIGEERMKMLEDKMGKDWIKMLDENIIGEDWSKIQHIKSIIIDGIQIQNAETSSSHQESSSDIG